MQTMKIKIKRKLIEQLLRQAEGLTKQYLMKLAQNDQQKVKQTRQQRRQQLVNQGFLPLVNNNEQSPVLQNIIQFVTRNKLQGKNLSKEDFDFLHDLIVDGKARMYIEKKFKEPGYSLQNLKQDHQQYKTRKEEQKRGGLTPQEHKQYQNVKVLKEFSNGNVWVIPLDERGKEKRACRITGKIAGHCGNKPNQKYSGPLYVLRKKDTPKVLITVATDKEGNIRQAKGNQNRKPSAKEFFQELYWLVSQPFVKGFNEQGRYAPQANFHVSDLSMVNKQRFKKLVESKPQLMTDYDKVMLQYMDKNLSNDQIFDLLMNDKLTLAQRLGLGL